MKTKLFAIFAASALLLGGCGILGGSNAGTVDALWSDVPQMDGLVKAKLDLPLPTRLMIQSAFQGRVDFISFTTAKAPADVPAFYTKERMAATGWKSDAGGCLGNTTGSTSTSQGAICLFNKKDAAKELGLAIIISQDEKTKQTQIFFARVDMTSATPAPGTAAPKSIGTPAPSERPTRAP